MVKKQNTYFTRTHTTLLTFGKFCQPTNYGLVTNLDHFKTQNQRLVKDLRSFRYQKTGNRVEIITDPITMTATSNS